MKKWIVLAALTAAASGANAQQLAAANASAPAGDKPYGTVVDGTKVNADVMEGFRTWRAAACDRCHGANQEGLVGP
ncbi:MAG: methanol dehydrogenase, partial [Pseudomonadota bacterium]|nr:methanol dehydrogenase [Pseudomonadota bacterium]